MTDIAPPRLFVDSADDAAVTELLRAGLVAGVTTNPTVLERDGVRPAELGEHYRRWASAGAQEIYFQTWGESTGELLDRARALLAHSDQIGIKVPATRIGFPAAAKLVSDGVSVLVTAVYTAEQALMAASIGARYIAPYFGRLSDAGVDAVSLIGEMVRVCGGSPTRVLAASLREPAHLVALREVGVSDFTARPDVLWALADSSLTAHAVDDFEAAMRRLA